MRDAISLMELCARADSMVSVESVNRILGTSSYEKMSAVAKSIANKEYSVLFDTINEVVSSSKDILVFFADLTSFYRDMMVVKSSASQAYLELIDSEAEMVKEASERFNMATLLYHISLLDNAYLNMQRNPVTKRLTAEITLMKMCDPRLSDTSDALISRVQSLEDKLTLLSRGIKIDEKEPQSNPQAASNDKETNEIEDSKPSPKDDAPKSKTRENEKVSEIYSWNEVATKVSETDPSVFGFLNKARCFYKGGKYFIVCENEFSKNILSVEATKSLIFNAMMLCDIKIQAISQLEIITNKKSTAQNGLEEF